MRRWRGYEDVRAMQQLALEVRRLKGPRAPWHVGDLAWGFRQHAGREHEWRIRLWEEMAPSSAGRSCAPTAARSTSTSIQITWSRSTRSWPSRTRARHSPSKTRDLHEPPPAPPLPDGFRLRTVEPDDLPARVDVHRDIWAPSRVTEESYANVMQTWPYRASLDCVVEAADGGFAAYALLWPDDVNRVGELEPVGTRAEFRGLGLGAAVCTYALRRWHDEGGRQAIVYCLTEPARALYRAVGFECHSRLTAYKRG